jgi:uncharacterized protein
MSVAIRLRWKFGLARGLPLTLALAFAAMRALGMLEPAQWRWLLPLSFVCMAASPWLLLPGADRRQIGLVRPARLAWFAPAIVLGAVAAAACFAAGLLAFGSGEDNWFVSIARNYRDTIPHQGFTTLQLFFVATAPALLFSPIGEEIFFRGLLQRALEERFSRRSSTCIEAVFFGLVHLCHHGLLATTTGIRLLPLSGALWVALMFCAALLFAWLRHRSGSLFPAMAGHASFNLAMNVCIFAALWPVD